MSGDGRAGGSADEQAQALRQKASRLEAKARRFEQGARGERLTASVLDPRSGHGWHVLHDLAVPDSRANIDHVVVTPAGVFIVDSKDWSETVSEGSGTLWVGRYPKRKDLAQLQWEVGVVGAALAAALPGPPIELRGVISLTNAAPARPVLHTDGIDAVGVYSLVQHLASQPRRIGHEQVDAVATAIDSRLRSKTGAATSIVPRRVPAPPLPARSSAVGRPSAGPRRTSTRQTRGSRSTASKVQPLAIAAAVILVVLVAGGVGLGTFLRHGIRLPANLQRSLSSAVAPPAPLQVTWSCPSPPRGWSASLAWPAGAAPPGTWLAQSAPSAAGPWTAVQTGQPTQPVMITGVTNHHPEWVRAGSMPSLMISGKASMAGELLPPSGC